ncbi:helicase-exonuclease AddAB subunit AddA [Pediococcus inopinatus]|uniref:helicase-exonuclease AddAB subunit AddA n=1 Tax=Pediococcus inopinatus TaxID=114090 RepID=UPI002B25AF0E|nr:helicase-exonuclease AddAB subunit AddA [Pediococcus inopinatus]WPC16836.1 helicase-exonuclease AddAB subunit AddA [Pediococcus inopinatus]
MGKTSFTPDQERAINHSGHNVLVSASAGSGKTSVLVQRVIKKILNGTDVDKLLVVTFTEAAAKEMHDRIQNAINDQIRVEKEADQRRHLIAQLTKLNTANISTIHAFCLSIIKRYYYVIDLDPVFRLLTDDTEGVLLREEVWNDLRESLYESEGELFSQLTANFSNDRSDDGFTDLMLRLYDFANATPDPNKWLAKLPEVYQINGKLNDTEFYQNQVLPVVKFELENSLEEARSLQNIMQDGNEDLEKFQPVIDDDVNQIQDVLTNGLSDWDTLRGKLKSLEFGKILGGKRTDEVKEFKERIKEIRGDSKNKNGYKIRLQELVQKYFSLNEVQMIDVLKKSESLVQELCKVTLAFKDAYAVEKRRRQILDFSDLEHFAMRILNGSSQESKSARAAYQRQFSEVIVDEYQDINPLQEAILTSVTSDEPGNMFMVGDVKQSIYAFRLADPHLFIGKDQSYQDEDAPGERIILSQNFRSVQNVDDFTNLIFEQLMDQNLGEIPYDEDAKLVYGAKYYPETASKGTEILVYDDEKTESASSIPETDSFEIDDKSRGQVAVAGQRIKQLVEEKTMIFDKDEKKERRLTYSDVVLLTPTRKNNLTIVALFKQMGIPVVVNDAQNYFQTTEIAIMMSLLKIIDNPYQDIPLVAVLRSPIVHLNENELAFLRINNKTGDYFQAVMDFYNHFDSQSSQPFQAEVYQKVGHFLEQLTHFQDIANQNQLATLIWTIYNETGFLDYVGGMPAGQQRQANLHALYDRAKSYEQTSFKGLFQFVRFIERMQKRSKDLAEVPINSDEAAVQVMTIHGSKGLEFPVVFLMDASHKFNTDSMKGKYILDSKEGIGITYLDPRTRLQVDTPQKLTIIDHVKRNGLAEEMRQLYVALTRAQQKLIIVGACDSQEKLLKKWQSAWRSDQLLLTESTRLGTNNFLDWIGEALIRHPQFNLESEGESPLAALSGDQSKFEVQFKTKVDLQKIVGIQTDQEQKDWWEEFEKATNDLDVTTLSTHQIDQVLNFKYPHEVATQTTAYQSVSEVKRLFDDPDSLEMTLSTVEADHKLKTQNRYVSSNLATPKFLQTTVKPKPTEIGTATHLILQEIPLTEMPTEKSVEDLIGQLVMNKVLMPEVANLVDIDNILRFFDSSLGQILLDTPDKVHREVPFSLLMPAKQLFNGFKDFSNDEETQILIHGIIDGYVELDDRAILFDYKTDYVKPGSTKNGVQNIISRYAGQVNLYAAALTDILKHPVEERYLYLLSIGELVEVH